MKNLYCRFFSANAVQKKHALWWHSKTTLLVPLLLLFYVCLLCKIAECREYPAAAGGTGYMTALNNIIVNGGGSASEKVTGIQNIGTDWHEQIYQPSAKDFHILFAILQQALDSDPLFKKNPGY